MRRQRELVDVRRRAACPIEQLPKRGTAEPRQELAEVRVVTQNTHPEQVREITGIAERVVVETVMGPLPEGVAHHIGQMTLVDNWADARGLERHGQ
ncbi:MAG: hypothetical protein HOW73_23230 [Polyangiaceae bacterium]|nr:hypothetical protein [Polyangiaceae bacterium]